MAARTRIGDLILDRGRRVLSRGSQTIPLSPLTYKLLVALAEAAPNVVSHDKLAEIIWDGRPVTPETLSQRVKLLRDALADDPNHPTYIEGVRGHGYRLLAPVEPIEDEMPRHERRRGRRSIAIAAALLVMAAAVGAVIALRTPNDAEVSAARSSPSIAVLPFTDLSETRDQQHIADGIAEETLNLLTRTTSLRVVARTSSFAAASRTTDLREIARVLGVSHVLEGSVRRSADRVRVNVRLLNAHDGSPVWSRHYDRSMRDILSLQAEISQSVAYALHSTFRSAADIDAMHPSSESYELYLRGQQLLRERHYGNAVRQFERLLTEDPKFVPAYGGLGLAYIMEIIDVRVDVLANREKLQRVLDRGLELTPENADLLALRAQLARYDGHIDLAEKTFAQARDREPSNAVVRALYPTFKLDCSDPRSALQLSKQSLATDPYNTFTYITIWASHVDLGEAEEAHAAAGRYLEISDPHDISGEFMRGVTSLLLLGDFVEGISAFERSVARLEPEYLGTPSWLPLLYYSLGDLDRADMLMEGMRKTPWDDVGKVAAETYYELSHGNLDAARTRARAALKATRIWGGADTDMIIMRLALDSMIASGEGQRVVAFVESLAPQYAVYKRQDRMDGRSFSPAPIAIKSAFTSFPALYFPVYIRALRASGEEAAAARMLNHLDAILSFRREQGLFIEERYTAEALALRGQTDAALSALEKAERDRTLYHWWLTEILHNDTFADIRDHPRFIALIERMRDDLKRQRERLHATK